MATAAGVSGRERVTGAPSWTGAKGCCGKDSVATVGAEDSSATGCKGAGTGAGAAAAVAGAGAKDDPLEALIIVFFFPP